jgi:hypothetical protein
MVYVLRLKTDADAALLQLNHRRLHTEL